MSMHFTNNFLSQVRLYSAAQIGLCVAKYEKTKTLDNDKIEENIDLCIKSQLCCCKVLVCEFFFSKRFKIQVNF